MPPTRFGDILDAMEIPASQQLLVLYSREQIEKRVAELGEAITRDYAGRRSL